MKHATTNYRALKKLIDSDDRAVRSAGYLDWFGDSLYYFRHGRDKMEVSINEYTKTARPIAVTIEGDYKVNIFSSRYVCNPKRVAEADEMLHDWLYPREVKNNGRIEGFKSLLPYM